jgi:hypothetical protein
MVMQPSPIAETSRLLFPSFRFFIFSAFYDVDGLFHAGVECPNLFKRYGTFQ